ncbi:hypothetical protein [aff. Roholtiella sp. LEGE 12411]|uniref:hypothetical protein n=1 Tax=aff. Roholtiella sp. LEGE 12411 TaxID=1828822 RepID=UPI00187FB3C2|nr:hypothetical protein [aff. Roholtiella sp. LEGE 12411]MBE9038821.1 hypothetical protein [aff. Roholtiella sp. LEGE 12411]
MAKLPECDCCLLYSHNPHLVCTVHPNGSVADTCLDFREDPNAEPVELWEPEGATYYNGELIVQPQQRWTQQQKRYSKIPFTFVVLALIEGRNRYFVKSLILADNF